ncbi:MAG TPA: sigma-70 family RNA polymerase sigma factor, partial [Candidatus Krumholzibacteria bacterium]|nr:sigma-70 family RNA polymerase sigma factor [Candidatus Krumholzibacteria bacterium]
VKTVWTSVLARLHEGQLRSYAGRSKLSTWLVVVARSAAIDHVRARRGRTHRPDSWESLSPRQQQVYRMLFVQGRTPDEARHALLAEGALEAGESLAEIVAGLEEIVGERALQRMAWNAEASSVGAVSGRLLEYLDHAVREAAAQGEALSPERRLHQEQARRTVERVRSAMQALPELERRALELRFDQGLQAESIGRELGIPRRREVYTLLDRALRNVRKLMGINILLIIWSIGEKIR